MQLMPAWRNEMEIMPTLLHLTPVHAVEGGLREWREYTTVSLDVCSFTLLRPMPPKTRV